MTKRFSLPSRTIDFQLMGPFPFFSRVSRTFDVGLQKNLPVSSVVKTSLSVRQVWDSRPEPVKSDTISPVTRHRFDNSSNFEAVLPRRWAAEMGPATCYTPRRNRPTASKMKIWFVFTWKKHFYKMYFWMPILLTLKFRFHTCEISTRDRATIMRSKMGSCVEKAKTTVLEWPLNPKQAK